MPPGLTGEPYDPPQLRDKVTQKTDGGDLVMPLVELRDKIISVLYLPGTPARCAEVRPRLIDRFWKNIASHASPTCLISGRAGQERLILPRRRGLPWRTTSLQKKLNLTAFIILEMNFTWKRLERMNCSGTICRSASRQPGIFTFRRSIRPKILIRSFPLS